MKKVYVESMNSCFANEQEGEKLKGFFSENGWEVVPDPREADLVVFNGCAFDRKKEDEGLGRIRRLKETKNLEAQMIVSGCLPGINPERLEKEFKGITVDARSFDRFDQMFRVTKSIREFKSVSNKKDRYLLEIATGCLGRCTFCGIKNAIGDIKSRPIAEIRREFQLGLSKGRHRFVLTSHDFGAYGQDIKESAPKLLRELLKVSGDYVLELDWMDPYWMKRKLEEYIELFQDPRIRKTFFMPLQSGNNRILRLMGRKYKGADFLRCVERLLKEVKDFIPQTEVIVGFPTETEEEFLDTLKTLSRFPFGNIQYYSFDPKPNTRGFSMEGQIPEGVKEERMGRMKTFVHRNNFLWRQMHHFQSHLDKREVVEIRAD